LIGLLTNPPSDITTVTSDSLRGQWTHLHIEK
jgi:hypothetical protein